MKTNRIDCFKCKFFYITWDNQHPKGCKAFQFKSDRLPSAEVIRASGHPCLRFEQKTNGR